MTEMHAPAVPGGGQAGERAAAVGTADDMTLPAIELVGVFKEFRTGGDVVAAVRVMDLKILEGEFFSLLGPSGCGKTTTLRMLAGFVEPTAGRSSCRQGRHRVPPNNRDVNMVFQSYALFPHMNVAENVAFGLAASRCPRTRSPAGSARCSSSSTWPAASTAAARAFRRPAAARRAGPGAGQPPAGAAARRAARRARPQAPAGDAGRAQADPARGRHHVRLVTHDQDEALTMSDRIAVMNDGGSSSSACRGDLRAPGERSSPASSARPICSPGPRARSAAPRRS